MFQGLLVGPAVHDVTVEKQRIALLVPVLKNLDVLVGFCEKVQTREVAGGPVVVSDQVNNLFAPMTIGKTLEPLKGCLFGVLLIWQPTPFEVNDVAA